MSRQLAVVGHPIKHSKSPFIHAAAYRVLGLDWHYTAIDVTEGRLLQSMETLSEDWLGLSVTMPLKFEASRSSGELVGLAKSTGVTNTLLKVDGGWVGYNTDVFGIQEALGEKLLQDSHNVLIIGSGATAISAAFAVLDKNHDADVTMVARNKESAGLAKARVEQAGFKLRVRTMGSLRKHLSKSQLVISTLPAGALDLHASKLSKSMLFKPQGTFLDVAYDPWPSHFASLWASRGFPIVSGIEMLIYQAIAQIRVFSNASTEEELPNERAVELAMRDSLGLL